MSINFFNSKYMNFSLALGWWAARGLAHIGVIRRLEELDMHPIALSGTSMGAIIATLLALGKSSREMEDIIASVPWMRLIDPDMKKWLLKGKKIELFLEDIFEGKTFADTYIPLSITATDIDTGESRVFQEGPLSEAVRASISLPWVFIPKHIDGTNLVDGGLAANLPIELLPPWPVIAVSALRDLSRTIHYQRRVLWVDWSKSIFGNTYNIIQKTIDIMLAQNEARSVASRKDVTYIRPSFDSLDYYEFHKYEKFILAGYQKAKEILPWFSEENL